MGLATGMSILGEPAQPPIGFTGAPGEGTCRNCHEGSVGGTIHLLDAAGRPLYLYTPGGGSYLITLEVSHPSARWYGFQATVIAEDDPADTLTGMGLISVSDSLSIQRGANGRRYINHRGFSSSGRWQFLWHPPAINRGPLTWYVSAISANGDGAVSGDASSSLRVTIQPDTATGLRQAYLWEGVLYIQAEAIVRIYSLDGRLLWSFSESGIHNVPDKGIFLMEVITREGRVVRRVANL